MKLLSLYKIKLLFSSLSLVSLSCLFLLSLSLSLSLPLSLVSWLPVCLSLAMLSGNEDIHVGEGSVQIQQPSALKHVKPIPSRVIV